MSEIKALEKLRKWSHRYDNGWIQEDDSVVITTNTRGVYYGENYGESIRAMIDEIEREISEKYMLLPVDADGVPIHVGDCITSDGENRLHVARLELRPYGWVVRCDGFGDYSPENTHHVKPRTIEDVLRDLEGMRGNNATYEDVVRRCAELAAEIRKMIGEGE